MAKDNDPWKKFREREDEQDEELSLKDRRTGGVATPAGKATPGGSSTAPSSEKIEDLMHKADVLIEQLGQIYQMYYVGIEKRPPTEKRAFLENLIIKIQNAPKPISATQFKWGTLQSKFNVHKEKWDRMLKDIENGKAPRGGGR